MRFGYVAMFLWMCLPLQAQLETVKEELTDAQLELYRTCALAVSAPCCKNGQPVLTHESPMTAEVRDIIKNKVLEGMNRKEIFASLAELTFGPNDEPLIFAVPKEDLVGTLVWWLPALIILFGVGLVIVLLRWQKKQKQLEAAQASDDEQLLAKYGERIESEVQHY